MKISHIDCWVPNRVKGCVEFISEGIFGKKSKMKVLVLTFFRPSTLKNEKFSKKIRVDYVYIEEYSFIEICTHTVILCMFKVCCIFT